jgi:hypothetical protein
MTTIAAYPLQWPDGWKRTEPVCRTRARFGKKRDKQSSYVNADGTRNTWKQLGDITIAEAVYRLRTELTAMGIDGDDLVISSNLELRLDGLPRSGQREPADPGVCVYWTDRGERSQPPRCMAIDRYDRVADNLAAVAATLAAMRAIERHGGAEILNRAFTGFVALEDQRTPWWDVLGVSANARLAEIEAAYRRRRSETHPDRGGNADDFDAVQRAYEQAKREVRA